MKQLQFIEKRLIEKRMIEKHLIKKHLNSRLAECKMLKLFDVSSQNLQNVKRLKL